MTRNQVPREETSINLTNMSEYSDITFIPLSLLHRQHFPAAGPASLTKLYI